MTPQLIISKVVVELINDPSAREFIRKELERAKKLNEEEHRRLSEREIERMICRAIERENPGITPAEAADRFERRLKAAMKPYVDGVTKQVKGPTGRDLYRAERKKTVKRGRQNRR